MPVSLNAALRCKMVVLRTYYDPTSVVCYVYIAACLDYARGADSVPLAVKYLFDYLDYEAHCVGITDSDVVHVWKNNR